MTIMTTPTHPAIPSSGWSHRSREYREIITVTKRSNAPG